MILVEKKPVFNYKKHKLNILDTQGELINDNLLLFSS